MKTLYLYSFNCTELSVEEAEEHLWETIVVAQEVTYSEFARACDWRWWAERHGYVVGRRKGLHLKEDAGVKFFKSTWRRKPCYYIVWSAQEHVFIPEGVSA